MEQQLLRVHDVCHVLGCCRSSVYKLIQRGHLRPVKLLGSTRFRASDVNALVERFANENTAGDQKGGDA